ncbi:alpha/beta hydrolase [Geodermatophilus obscurus]|uniref:TAP domain protein n=1 Tax=Geodermatophilus obscurus (strain ATCC 25078 / DSM 43160 / JCM 3152 / CCUG 61914 / KCC A-0152 / KCTC 9177 / NBRC 13315 / NRRL B-3577 / G-20) TaxID=526225 RepID=D2SEV2_GEOOG|nr:alpha/beta fold hydrolase [Geodermatophilus obscurus]ADB74642.1 TAP domain protein [Geodermatophilus obscurus DSM 43160]
MRVSRGLVAAATGLLVAVSGCTSSDDGAAESTAPASSAPAEPEAAEIAWTDCDPDLSQLVTGLPGSERDLAFECGRTEVPISYDEPQGATLPLFLVRARLAGQTDRIGSLVINPGGPGGSGADAALGQALTLPEDVLRRFDVVGFDPRGVGLSTPVECIPPDVKDRVVAAEPRPTTPEQVDEAFALQQELADGCAEEYGEALGTFNTVDTARDMDLLRQSLGDERLTYLGYSYGTTLGSTYAELFPDRVRALVLDAAVDPDDDPRAEAEQQATSLEASFDAYAANCVGLVAGCPLGPDPRRATEELLDQAAAAPIPSARPGETRQATPGIVMTAVLYSLYDAGRWPQLTQALSAARNGDAAGVFSLADAYWSRMADGTYTNTMDANLAINCADTDPATEVPEDEVRTLTTEWGQRFPLFGAGAAVGLRSCAVWEAERTPIPERDAEGAAPILVVGTAGDPVTPLPGAVDMAEDLASGVLLTWQGQGHTAYPRTGCVTGAVNAYLIDLAVPQDGQTCPA